MKNLFTLALLLFSHVAWAQLRCVDKLLPLPRLSAPHQLSNGEWRSGDEEKLTPEDAIRAVNTLVFAKLLCRDTEIEVATVSSCTEMDPTIPNVTCLTNSSLGYFIISQDTAKNVNLIFHRVRSPQK